jgi:hypothetical protein
MSHHWNLLMSIRQGHVKLNFRRDIGRVATINYLINKSVKKIGGGIK